MQPEVGISTEPTSGNIIGAPDSSDALAGEPRPAGRFCFMGGWVSDADPAAEKAAVQAESGKMLIQVLASSLLYAKV